MSALRVNIRVTAPDLQWIGGRFARELVARLPRHGVEAEINGRGLFDLSYDQIVYSAPESRPAVGLFTHGESRPRQFASAYDGHITLSPTLRGFLLEAGAPAPVIVSLPVDGRFSLGRPLVFGVAGRVYADGRKGESLVAAAVAAGHEFRAWGSGWPCKSYGTDLADLVDFYRAIDYYVETCSDEGGCVGASEAMAMGVPVISHQVGVTYPVIPYERGSEASLLAVLRRLTHPYTYDDFAEAHALCFHETMARVEIDRHAKDAA